MVKKFYQSNPFTLTLEQLQWLEDYNASEVIRCLLDISMTSKKFKANLKYVISLNNRIVNVLKSNNTDALEGLRKQRKHFIARLFDLEEEA